MSRLSTWRTALAGAAGLGHVHTGQNAPIDTTKKLDKFYVLNSWIVSMLSRQLPQEPRIRLSGRFATDISLGIRDFTVLSAASNCSNWHCSDAY